MPRPGKLSYWMAGVLGLALGPTLLWLDTFLARSRGWHHQSADSIQTIQWLTASSVLAILVVALLPGFSGVLRRHGHRVGLLGIALVLGTIISESLLAWLAPQPPFHHRQPSTVYSFNPDPIALRGVSGPATYRTNSDGIRGPELDAPDSYRILCIGGSTTECPYLDDSETWPTLLGELLAADWNRPVWVGAAAVSEFASGHHLRYLRQSDLAPTVDRVVVMPGANDLLRLFFELDSGEVEPPYWYQSNLLGLVRQIWNVRLGHGMLLDSTGEQLRIRRLGPGDSPSAPISESRDPRAYAFRPRELDFDAAVADFERRLTQLAELAKAKKIPLTLVTQPVLWEDFLDAIGQNKLLFARVYPYPRTWDLLTATKLRKIMYQYNEAIRLVAAKTDTDFVDPATEMNGRQEYFYDDFHLNELGCQRLATLLARHLAEH